MEDGSNGMVFFILIVEGVVMLRFGDVVGFV